MTKIAIIGESCIDEYIYGVCDRICPEAAAFCFKTDENKKINLGMAANVLNNIKFLDPTLDVTLLTNKNTIIKRRFIDSRYNTIIFRADVNDQCDNFDISLYNFNDYDAIVFSDYCKGLLSEQIISDICQNTRQDCCIFMDTKRKITSFIKDIDFLKINQRELKQNVENIDEIKHYTNIIVTQGEAGAIMYKKNETKTYPVQKIEVRDVCGAGDTFLAGLVVEYLKSKNIDQSINFANICASKVVSKFGVTTP